MTDAERKRLVAQFVRDYGPRELAEMLVDAMAEYEKLRAATRMELVRLQKTMPRDLHPDALHAQKRRPGDV